MVSTSLMVDTIPVPPHPILLCALNYALTLYLLDKVPLSSSICRSDCSIGSSAIAVSFLYVAEIEAEFNWPPWSKAFLRSSYEPPALYSVGVGTG